MAAEPARPPTPRDEDDVGDHPVFLVHPDENVYSFFMLVAPTEHKKDIKKGHRGRFNWDVAMSYFLVGLNLFMQAVLVALIFEELVVTNVEWQNGIMKLGSDPAMGLFVEPPAGCNDGGALCFKDHGNFSCAPPSIQLTAGRWNELDTNRDGIWTRDEMMASRKALKCKYVADPVDIFDTLINMLISREKVIWLHPDIRSKSAIHLPYFNYAMGDLLICGYRSADMCSNLLQRGFFDAPLKYGTAPRVGVTIESALKYCTQLLESGGTCSKLLPSTYSVWKVSSEGECGSPSYSPFKYTNPANGVTKSLLSVDYSARAEFALAQEYWFKVFKSIMIFIWLTAMLVEFKRVIVILTFCARMPTADEDCKLPNGEDAVIIEADPSDPEDVRYRIKGIEDGHRKCLVVLCIARACITCVLTIVGLAYLIKTNGYADLLMNGVSLAFISEIPQVLYDLVLREQIKDQTSDIKGMKVEKYGIDWLNRKPALVDVLCVAGTILVTYGIMEWQLHAVVLPVAESLECTCLGGGKNCVEAQKFNYDFWHDYWKNGVPGIYAEVAKLKATVPAGALAAAPAAALKPAAASYLAAPTSVKASPDRLERQTKTEEQIHSLLQEHEVLETNMKRLEEELEGNLLTETQHKKKARGKGRSHESKA